MNERGDVRKFDIAAILAYLLVKWGKGTALIDFWWWRNILVLFLEENINKLEITSHTLRSWNLWVRKMSKIEGFRDFELWFTINYKFAAYHTEEYLIICLVWHLIL